MSEQNGQPIQNPAEPTRHRVKLRTKPVILEFEEGGSVKEVHCTLVELSGDKRDDYINLTIARNKVDMTTGVRFGYDVKDLEAILVQQCLRDDKGQEFPLHVVKGWPGSLQSALYDDCTLLNGLDKKAKETAKKG